MKGKNKRSYKRGADKRNGGSQDNSRFARGRDDRDAKNAKEARSSNDISWYSKYPNLLVGAGSFPYPNRPGMSMHAGSISAPNATGLYTTAPVIYKVPGVMALDWIPSLGNSSASTDPASVLGKEMYGRVRSVYSGSLTADAPDFVMYVMALDSVFAYIGYLKRIFRTINAYSPENYMIPDNVLRAMGLDGGTIQNLRLERIDLWNAINTLALQVRKFKCPAVMDVMNRHYWMSDNVYTDANSINSQFYLFNLYGVYKFEMLNTPQDKPAPGLSIVTLPHISATAAEATSKSLHVADFLNFGIGLIQALNDWDDSFDISGYLMRAFPDTPSFVVDEIDLGDVLTPVYNEEVLVQIENSHPVLGGSVIYTTQNWTANASAPDFKKGFGNFSVTQDPTTNAVLSMPYYWLTYKDMFELGLGNTQNDGLKPFLSIRSDQPTVADSVVASRLKATTTQGTSQGGWSASATDGGRQFWIQCASEVPLGWRVIDATPLASQDTTFNLQTSADFLVPSVFGFNFAWDTTVTPPSFKANVDPYKVMKPFMNAVKTESFDWHPFIGCYYSQAIGGSTSPEFGWMGDTHNITVIESNDLQKLHTVCLYSEFSSFSIL